MKKLFTIFLFLGTLHWSCSVNSEKFEKEERWENGQMKSKVIRISKPNTYYELKLDSLGMITDYSQIQGNNVESGHNVRTRPIYSFFKMDNPLWYILSLAIVAFITHSLSKRQTKSEAVTEAKKLFLEKRINAHQELYGILSRGMFITNYDQERIVFHKIFTSKNDFNDWFDELITYAGQNKTYLSHNVNKNLTILNELRKHIHTLIVENDFNDIQLSRFAHRNFDELSEIFKRLETSIKIYFEEEISLNYKFGNLSKQDLDNIKEDLKKYQVFASNHIH